MWKERSIEEIEKIIEKTAELIIKYEIEDPAILFFETIKPVAPIGGRLGGAAFAWLIPLIGHGLDDYFVVFQEPKNIEKLLKLIEKKRQATREAKKDSEKIRAARRKKEGRFWSHFNRIT